MTRFVDSISAYRILRMLTTPFEEIDAFRLGIVDARGKELKKKVGEGLSKGVSKVGEGASKVGKYVSEKSSKMKEKIFGKKPNPENDGVKMNNGLPTNKLKTN